LLGQSEGKAGSEEVVDGEAVVGFVADVGSLLTSVDVFVARPRLVGSSLLVVLSVVFTSGFCNRVDDGTQS